MKDIIKELTEACEEKDCRIEDLGSTRTLLGWYPTYDRDGYLVSSDPNTTTTHYKCSVCGMSWRVREQYGMYTIGSIYGD
jgi:hypothetical protein